MGFSLGDLNPVKAIDKALVGLDKSVKNVGGWEVVGPAAAALIAAPYLAPELLATDVGMVDAAGNIIGGGTQGAALGASGAAAVGPTYAELGYTGLEAGQMGPTYGDLGYTGFNQSQAIAQADAAAKAAGGLTGAQKAMLVRSAGNALGQAFGGAGTSNMGGNGYGGSGSGGYNYASLPYLANPQQNQTYMKTGPDVSGSGITTAGMPVQLDTTRHNILMANLLRG